MPVWRVGALIPLIFSVTFHLPWKLCVCGIIPFTAGKKKDSKQDEDGGAIGRTDSCNLPPWAAELLLSARREQLPGPPLSLELLPRTGSACGRARAHTVRCFWREAGGAEDEVVLTRLTLTLALALDLAVTLRFRFSTFF